MTAATGYAVILDRDQTINADPGYLNDPAKVELLPRAAEGIALLNRFNIPVYVATNQSGVARGIISEFQLAAVNQRILQLLAAGGARVEKIYVCPHNDDSNCDCRKPKPGLVRQILMNHKLDPARTFIAGDRARDLACGVPFNIRGIHVGSEKEPMPANFVFQADDLYAVAGFVLETIFEEETLRKVYLSAEAFIRDYKQFLGVGKKIIFTNGCFDILHSGHVQLLSQARALGDFLILGLNSDRSVRKLKGENRPVNNQHDRARILAQLPYIDAVVIFDEDTPVELMQKLKPDIQVKGGDYIKEKLPEYEVMKGMGKEIVILPFRKGYSTTSILARR